MRAQKLTYDVGFDILKFLSKEINYHVWNPAISGYTWLRNRLRHVSESQATFDVSKTNSVIVSSLSHYEIKQQIIYDSSSNTAIVMYTVF